MAGLFGGSGTPANRLLGAAPASNWSDRLSLLGAALQDAGANFEGNPGAAVNLARAKQGLLQTQVQQAARDAASQDPNIRQRAYATLAASGVDITPFQKNAAAQATPALLDTMTNGRQMNGAESAKFQGVDGLPRLPVSGVGDALSAVGSPELSAEYAPVLLKQQIEAQQKAVHTIAPEEYGKYGIDPATVPPGVTLQADAFGKVTPVKYGDMKSPGAIDQQIEVMNRNPQLAISRANLGMQRERLDLDRKKLQVENPFQGGQNSFGPGALAAAPLATQSTVKAMIEGRMAPPSSMALRTPYWQNMLALANSADPTFDQTEWGARANARKDFTGGGKSYQMLNSGNTVIQHLGRLNNQISDVAGTSVPVLNSVENFTAMHTGRPGVNAYNDTLGHLAEETTKFYRGTGGNEDDIKRTMENLSPNLSAAQKQSGVANTVHLIYGKLQPMVEQYNKTMGTNFPPSHFLSKEAVNTMKGMGYDPDTGEKVNGGGHPSVNQPRKTIKFGDLP